MAQPPHATCTALPWTILFPCFVYPIVTVFSSYILDTNASNCVVNSALYTLTELLLDMLIFSKLRLPIIN